MGDAYFCKHCRCCLSSHSKLFLKSEYQQKFSQALGDKEEEKEEPSNLHKEKVITTAIADTDKVWVCEFCGVHNLVNLDNEEVPKTDDVIYLLKSAQQINKNCSDLSSDITTIFCIDNSGSMSVTQEIKGKHDFKHGLSEEEYEMLKQFIEYGADQHLPNQKKDTTFITRKQCVLAAIENQLLDMKSEYPNRRVGLVTFDDEVNIIGDGKNTVETVTGDKLYKYDILQKIGEEMGQKLISSPVKESAENLIKKFEKLKESGKTALGPALLVSLGLAMQGKQGSRVILCTDGLANIGLGDMDTPEGLAKAEEFYTRIGNFAKERGISVSVISIKGEGCKLGVMGKLADLTSGSLIRVDPNEITNQFASIMKQEVIGTQVEIKLRVHRGMKFRNEADEFLRERGSLYEKKIGNVTASSELTFEYEIRPDEELVEFGVDSNKLESVPFQAQIIYHSTNGDRLMRVITQTLKTTQNLEEAEKELNVNLLAARALHQQADFASKGRYDDSNKIASAWGGYMQNRVASKVNKSDAKVLEKYNMSNAHMQQVSSKRKEKKSEPKESKGMFSKAKEAISQRFTSLSTSTKKSETKDKKMNRKDSIDSGNSSDSDHALFHEAKNCNSKFA